MYPWTCRAFRCQTQWREGYSTFGPGPAGNTLQIGKFYLHLGTSNSNGWLRPQLGDVDSSIEADGSSLNRQWLEFELTQYNILNPATRRRWHNDKKLWSGQSIATEYTWRSRSWRWHSAADPTPENKTQGLGEYMQNSNGEKTEVSTNIRFTNLKIPILWETRETIPRTWPLKVSLLSNFTARMSRVGLERIETADKTKSPWEGFPV